ncbi:MAG: phosphodiester glycosidase family protein [Spirochaetaceae bacterium]|nr:phosphodiester glycosidase family protein [Spirochaetaceae bacterium]
MKPPINLKHSFILLLLPLLVSCATLDIARWEAEWVELNEAMAVCRGKIASPYISFVCVRVDMTNPDIAVITNEPGPQAGTVLSTKVSSFVANYNCTVGINAGPFSPVNATEGEDRHLSGIFISKGLLVSMPDPHYDALVFYKDAVRRPVIVSQSDITDTASIETALGGFNKVLQDGIITVRNEAGAARHPRSACGISADGRFLYLLAIDGRQLSSFGASLYETGELLLRLGSDDGLNFDGGGSTCIALQDGDAVKILNSPIDNVFRPGSERAVSSCLGIQNASRPRGLFIQMPSPR